MLQNNYHWPAPVNTMQRQYTLAASHKSPRDFHIHGACSAVRPASMEAWAAGQPAPQESYGSQPVDPQSPTITAAQEEAERAGFSRDHSNFRTPVGRFQQSPSVPLLPSCCAAVNATGHLCCLPADVMCSVPAAAQA